MAKGRKTPKWRSFEIAVARFAAAMDPRATVRHNFYTPDSDTQRRRQRDVWIEATVCGLFPITAHVSCKRYKRKLHEGDIDTFIGELCSSRAHKGVLYSYAGFAEPAIEKARVRGICCCRLYEDQPADLPEALWFDAYCCSSQIRLSLDPSLAPANGLKRWDDLFQITLIEEGKAITLIDALVQTFHEGERAAVEESKCKGGFPQPFAFKISLPKQKNYPEITIVLQGCWKVYRGKLEAFLLNGSYSFSTGKFVGEMSTPTIDRLSTEPGPGWERLASPPEAIDNAVVTILYSGEAKTVLQEELGPSPIARGA